jgi:hypothetical protein
MGQPLGELTGRIALLSVHKDTNVCFKQKLLSVVKYTTFDRTSLQFISVSCNLDCLQLVFFF